MFNKFLNWLKEGWSYILVFIFGFFLLKKGIDTKVLQDMAIEKAKEDALKKEMESKESEEKQKIEQNTVKKQQEIEEQSNKKIEEIKESSELLKQDLNKLSEDDPDKFGQQFADKFNISYKKEK